MSATAAPVATPEVDAKAQLDAVLGKVLPFAEAADAVARRTVGKVRSLAVLGLLSAMWLSYACADAFDWRLGTTFVLFSIISIPSAILWKIHRTLSSVIGLPQRTIETATRLYGKGVEYRELYERRRTHTITGSKPTLLQVYRTAVSILEAKALADDAQQVVSLAGSALILGNPLFGITLALSTAVTSLLVLVGAIAGVAYLI